MMMMMRLSNAEPSARVLYQRFDNKLSFCGDIFGVFIIFIIIVYVCISLLYRLLHGWPRLVQLVTTVALLVFEIYYLV